MYHSCTSKNIGYGTLAGFIGGIVFGLMMTKMGVLIKIGSLVGMSNPIAGFVVHLIISMFMGVIFALIFYKVACKRLSGTLWGLVYGIFWWFLGPLTLLSRIMDESIVSRWNITGMKNALPGLLGHIVFGLIMGFVYGWLRSREKKRKQRQLKL